MSPFSSWIKEDLNNYSKEILSKSYYNSNLLNYDNIEKLIDGYKKNINNSLPNINVNETSNFFKAEQLLRNN